MFKLTDKPIVYDELAARLEDHRAGALVSLAGKVRNHHNGRQVRALSYEAFPEFCHEEAAKIIHEAMAQFDIFNVEVVHRIGNLELGDIAVWIGAIAAHRQEAFLACQYVIDEIKVRLPIWKKEHYVEGISAWVGCQHCEHYIQERELEQQDYYSRQICLPGFGLNGQQRLQKAKVLVVGAGALGCAALHYLAAAGVGTIQVADGDNLEISNLHRQTLYCYKDVGQPKAKLAAKRLKAMNPFINVVSQPTRVNAANLHEIANGSDVIVDCCDNFATRFLLHDYGYLNDIPVVSAAIYQNEGQLNIFHRSQKGCLRCLWPRIPDERCIGTCQESGIIGAVAGVFGAMQAHEVIKWLLDWPVDKQNTILFDLVTKELKHLERFKNPNCPLCGSEMTFKSFDTPSTLTTAVFDISPGEYRKKAHNFIVVDIRETWERRHLSNESQGWLHISSSNKEAIQSLSSHKNYLLVCQSGQRSHKLCQELHDLGKTNYFSLKGGEAALR